MSDLRNCSTLRDKRIISAEKYLVAANDITHSPKDLILVEEKAGRSIEEDVS